MTPDSPHPLEVPSDGYAGAKPSPDLVPVFIPTLAALLLNREKEKGSDLTPEEVLAIRDQATCMMMRRDLAAAMDEKRGYSDLNPERCWEEFLDLKRELGETGNASSETN